MRGFRSDNNSGLCPEALQAIIDANDGGHSMGYGDDPFTADALAAFGDQFGDEVAVFFVATGTAANVLAVASLTEPWEQVLCHVLSHYNEDESTAPERLTHCRTVQIRTPEGTSKITPEDIVRCGELSRRDVHQPQPGVVTISNPTEMGEVYSVEQMRAICDAAHELGYRVHVDGARFANAVASLSCDPRDVAGRAGVDALSFGGTKNGLAAGEAVVFFPHGDQSAFERAVRAFPFHRKGSGHLLSKHRFVSAPFAATLRDGVWLRHALHANAMARMLSDGLRELGLPPAYPTQANGIFLHLPDPVHQFLQEAGQGYYAVGSPAWGLYRFMASFDTTASDVEHLLAVAAAAQAP